jgi:hypothetical protein
LVADLSSFSLHPPPLPLPTSSWQHPGNAKVAEEQESLQKLALDTTTTTAPYVVPSFLSGNYPADEVLTHSLPSSTAAPAFAPTSYKTHDPATKLPQVGSWEPGGLIFDISKPSDLVTPALAAGMLGSNPPGDPTFGSGSVATFDRVERPSSYPASASDFHPLEVRVQQGQGQSKEKSEEKTDRGDNGSKGKSAAQSGDAEILTALVVKLVKQNRKLKRKCSAYQSAIEKKEKANELVRDQPQPPSSKDRPPQNLDIVESELYQKLQKRLEDNSLHTFLDEAAHSMTETRFKQVLQGLEKLDSSTQKETERRMLTLQGENASLQSELHSRPTTRQMRMLKLRLEAMEQNIVESNAKKATAEGHVQRLQKRVKLLSARKASGNQQQKQTTTTGLNSKTKKLRPTSSNSEHQLEEAKRRIYEAERRISELERDSESQHYELQEAGSKILELERENGSLQTELRSVFESLHEDGGGDVRENLGSAASDANLSIGSATGDTFFEHNPLFTLGSARVDTHVAEQNVDMQKKVLSAGSARSDDFFQHNPFFEHVSQDDNANNSEGKEQPQTTDGEIHDGEEDLREELMCIDKSKGESIVAKDVLLSVSIHGDLKRPGCASKSPGNKHGLTEAPGSPKSIQNVDMQEPLHKEIDGDNGLSLDVEHRHVHAVAPPSTFESEGQRQSHWDSPPTQSWVEGHSHLHGVELDSDHDRVHQPVEQLPPTRNLGVDAGNSSNHGCSPVHGEMRSHDIFCADADMNDDDVYRRHQKIHLPTRFLMHLDKLTSDLTGGDLRDFLLEESLKMLSFDNIDSATPGMECAMAWILLQVCELTRLDRVRMVVPTLERYRGEVQVTQALETFSNDVCQAVVAASGGEEVAAAAHASRVYVQEGGGATMVSLRDCRMQLNALIADYKVMKRLQGRSGKVAHKMILYCQRLVGASALDDIPPKMQLLLNHLRENRSCLLKIRSMFALSPMCTLQELMDIIRGYCTTFGLTNIGMATKSGR